ncbi:MAG: response regulator [Alphaproteobacteria bacterium]|nr:response regulator [Alphaproteobacteria bacterium]TAD90213.1 MAG: response regulator [Alphaproteobacteria bacterium]
MSKRVLTVDDSKTMRDMVVFTLRQGGYDTVEACDGSDALRHLASGRFDCVITDLNMPVMDGIELVRSVRSDATHRGVPILMLTTESDTTKKDAGRAAGATGWLVKPFDPDKLLATVRKVCP